MTRAELRARVFNRKLVKAASNSSAGRPKATLLFWLCGDFRCCVPFFIVILVIF